MEQFPSKYKSLLQSKKPLTWLTSDLHFDHLFVANTRGHETTQAHDESVVSTINSYVRPGDVIWILGDTGMGRLSRFRKSIESINGKRMLVAGNHDAVHPMHRPSLEKIEAWNQRFYVIGVMGFLRHEGIDLMLSHFPYVGEGQRDQEDRHKEWRPRNEGLPLIHGHTHDSDQLLSFHDGTPMVHVGWDAWRRPVLLQEVVSRIADHV